MVECEDLKLNCGYPTTILSSVKAWGLRKSLAPPTDSPTEDNTK